MGQRLRNWCFTLYEYVDGRGVAASDTPDKLFDGVDSVRCGIWQLECCPATQRHHIQGYVEFNSSVRMAAVKGILGPTVHLEGRKGTREQAIEYCRKLDSRVNGPWEHGDLGQLKPGRRSDLDNLADGILSGISKSELVEHHAAAFIRYSRGVEALYNIRTRASAPAWRDISCRVYYGDAGTGKTRRAVTESAGDYYILQQGERLWFDGYESQGTLIIDDFYGWIKYGTMLALLDGYTFRCEVKGSFTHAFWTTVIITSNAHPDTWYARGMTPALRRRITEIVHFSELANPINHLE